MCVLEVTGGLGPWSAGCVSAQKANWGDGRSQAKFLVFARGLFLSLSAGGLFCKGTV